MGPMIDEGGRCDGAVHIVAVFEQCSFLTGAVFDIPRDRATY